MSLLRSHTPYPLLPPYLSPLLAHPLCFLSFVVLKSEQRWKTGKMLWHAEWRCNKASSELACSLSHAMFPSTQISTCRYTNVRLSRAVNTVFIICEQTSILPKINLYKTERWQHYKHFLHTDAHRKGHSMVASISILSSSPIAPTLPSSPFLFPSLQRAAVPLLSEYFSGWWPNPSDALILFIRAHPSAPYSLKQRNLVVLINKKLISNNFDIKLFFCKYFFPSLVPVFQMGVSSGKHDVASLFQYVHKNTLMEN